MELAKYLDSCSDNNYCSLENRPLLSAVPKAKRKKKKQPLSQLFRLYDDWSEQRLMNRASVVGIKGWAKMTKEELVQALRQG